MQWDIFWWRFSDSGDKSPICQRRPCLPGSSLRRSHRHLRRILIHLRFIELIGCSLFLDILRYSLLGLCEVPVVRDICWHGEISLFQMNIMANQLNFCRSGFSLANSFLYFQNRMFHPFFVFSGAHCCHSQSSAAINLFHFPRWGWG